MQLSIKALISTASLIHPIKHTFNFGNVNWKSLEMTFQSVDNLLYHLSHSCQISQSPVSSKFGDCWLQKNKMEATKVLK